MTKVRQLFSPVMRVALFHGSRLRRPCRPRPFAAPRGCVTRGLVTARKRLRRTSSPSNVRPARVHREWADRRRRALGARDGDASVSAARVATPSRAVAAPRRGGPVVRAARGGHRVALQPRQDRLAVGLQVRDALPLAHGFAVYKPECQGGDPLRAPVAPVPRLGRGRRAPARAWALYDWDYR